MKQQFDSLKQQFTQSPYPSLAQRTQWLQALEKGVRHYSDKLCQALSIDFGHRSIDETRLLEIMPTLSGIDYQIKHVKRWMKVKNRQVHYSYWPASNQLMPQPLGVVGIIVPWNYPIYLATGPLMAALAAGNKVMLKLSEYTPATNSVINAMLSEFLPEQVIVIEGDAEVAAEFSSLAFDHLLFTGSSNIGRKVMQAAAANLTPVTLELGGKSPVLIAKDANLASVMPRLLFGKTANAGQTCVAPDYVLLPREQLDLFIKTAKQRFKRFYPAGVQSTDYSAIINQQQFSRLQSYLAEAEQAQAQIISLDEQHWQQSSQRKLAPQLVINAPLDAAIWQQEIFGPILPIMLYDDIEQAISFINQQPRPLALYLFSPSTELQQQVMQRTHAGGVCINDSLMHVAQDDLPFGGIGPSGMGAYHGEAGFLTFSHQKAIHKKGRFSSGRFIYPPFNRTFFRLILNWLLR
ncbi:coniferyl aldehyde dehydrogenase [Rheinheimera salexigens]|uniref:Aldehyde dehydrogenase n=1 Tax=Rheinheimera salexigens TaxID=1628148 RepID=A0A1E7Q760_9GAMM|nr:coniferyl aldehyde dehydrogenase [Rheinheimera salexigens]OEY69931.1 coniferyl-aldehyde dehydrogenase [Rheinheimera salexigens]